ncbi:hypothetical protein AF335_25255 [Streptomyces eurocidicus]|uniref:D-inositol 3-phosphate glycosyltransferase n=1 Tax=Streptomyces eurocidicus TaxID=66423 RepID=A0A2N8NRD9_STREU|nr:DUF3492 domain-containing protein [Streptomyces eurocidicus]MBB5117143.1 glycosyltransferase involved in cell wall biosynthesis [Streptomyces eurocidicus]MBF6052563.1 DUF3492 domain-containing protein [Streptomyces eurocidicus]PNE31338.1 hypothetical protein AF335_25255 [Streptomyces eurocidicus]
MRVGLLTEGGYPYAAGEGGEWCDQLVRGLDQHDFEVYALSRGARQERGGWYGLPKQVRRVRTAPLWGDPPEGDTGRAYGAYGRRERQRFEEHFGELAAAICATDAGGAGGAGGSGGPGGTDRARGGSGSVEAPGASGAPGDSGAVSGTAEGGAEGTAPSTEGQAYRFAEGLHGLADLAREAGGLGAALRSEQALRTLEAACRAPGAHPAAYGVRVADLLAVSAFLERALRPLSLDWYGAAGDHDRGLAAVDLCHATSAGPAALPGLLAKRFFGTPLLVTEYEVRLRAYYLNSAAGSAGLPLAVRTPISSFHRLLSAEVYGRADLITPGDARVRRWQERCGAARERLRTVHPGVDERPYEAVGEGAGGPQGPVGAPLDDGRTLLWLGPPEPHLWDAFAAVRAAEPAATLRVVGAPPPGAEPPDGVTYEEAVRPETYAAGSVVLAGAADAFPLPLVEAMFCGRATVAADACAVREAVGGTGLVVPPGDPGALATGCLDLLRDPARRALLGAAARERALELFTVERHVTAFRGIYLELISRAPVRQDGSDPAVPFGRAAGAHPPLSWSPRAASPTWAGRS